MLDKSLFLKSLPEIDLSGLKGRTFTDKHKDKFKPKTEKEVRFYNNETINSRCDSDLKFVNFISDKNDGAIINRLEDLNQNLKMIREISPDEVRFNKDRIEKIIKLYIEDFDVKNLADDQVMKVSLVNSLGEKEAVRVYFLLNETFDAYEIILIDPFHLVIPSDHRDKKGKKIEKEIMMKRSFNQNQHNKTCISSYFNLVK